MAKVDARWYDREARREIQRLQDRALTALALQVEAQAKVEITNNGQIDTGFMRTTGYTIAPNVNTFSDVAPDGEYTSSREGRLVRRERVPTGEQPRPGEAVVGFAADYAIHQELRNSFLYRAAEMVAGRDAEATIQRAVRGG